MIESYFKRGKKTHHIILRIGLAFAFIYPAISAIFDPDSWIGYFPQLMKGYVPDPVLLHAFGASEILIALWIIFGEKIKIPAFLAVLYLIAIIGFNFAQIDVIFRDVSILAIALALFMREFKKENI